jgi:O-antigen ligase
MLTLTACVALGGMAANETLANAALQFLSLPLLAVAMVRSLSPRGWRGAGDVQRDDPRPPPPGVGLSAFVAAMVALPLLHLTPLPFFLWSHLPMREKAAAALAAIGQTAPAAPLSLAPGLTWLTFLSLIPPLAIFLGFRCPAARDRWRAVYLLIALAILNGFLGLLQLAQGADSPLRLYGADTEVDGVFANRNHFAAFIFVMIPFAGAVLTRALAAFAQDRETGKPDPLSILSVAASVLIIVTLIAAGVMSRSRAGVALLMLALLATAGLPRWGGLLRPDRATGGRGFGGVFGLIAGAGLLFALQYGLFRLLTRFDADPMEDARLTIADVTWRGALKAFPAGTGFGSFQQVYLSLERPADLYASIVNAAHNEYLQLFLEGGAVALVAGALFLFWYLGRSLKAWREPFDPLSSPLKHAASVSVALLLLHSLVDYPLRTGALGCVFAICCALLADASAPRARRADAARRAG